MPEAIDDRAMDTLFRSARTQNAWRDEPVPDETLHQLYDLMKWAPTSANGFPARIVFVTSDEQKAKLAELAMKGNRPKILSAPVTAILCHDPKFYRKLPELFPHNPGMAKMYEADSDLAEITAFRNGTLQGAYFLLAARALGLDCGPMSGFDNSAVDRIFLAESGYRSNFLCSIGYGDPAGVHPRLPRPEFDQVCAIV